MDEYRAHTNSVSLVCFYQTHLKMRTGKWIRVANHIIFNQWKFSPSGTDNYMCHHSLKEDSWWDLVWTWSIGRSAQRSSSSRASGSRSRPPGEGRGFTQPQNPLISDTLAAPCREALVVSSFSSLWRSDVRRCGEADISYHSPYHLALIEQC